MGTDLYPPQSNTLGVPLVLKHSLWVPKCPFWIGTPQRSPPEHQGRFLLGGGALLARTGEMKPG